jgi:hypothetical protein
MTCSMYRKLRNPYIILVKWTPGKRLLDKSKDRLHNNVKIK